MESILSCPCGDKFVGIVVLLHEPNVGVTDGLVVGPPGVGVLVGVLVTAEIVGVRVGVLVGVRVGVLVGVIVGPVDVGVRVGVLVGVLVGVVVATVLSVYSTTSVGLSAELSRELNFRSSVLERLAGNRASENILPACALTALVLSTTSTHELAEPPLIEPICVEGLRLAFEPL